MALERVIVVEAPELETCANSWSTGVPSSEKWSMLKVMIRNICRMSEARPQSRFDSSVC